MNITCDITNDMTPQDKEIFFKHQEMRNTQEAEKIQQEKEHLLAYKKSLIEDILENNNVFTYEELSKKSYRALERMLGY